MDFFAISNVWSRKNPRLNVDKCEVLLHSDGILMVFPYMTFSENIMALIMAQNTV